MICLSASNAGVSKLTMGVELQKTKEDIYSRKKCSKSYFADFVLTPFSFHHPIKFRLNNPQEPKRSNPSYATCGLIP